jgi:hypothetical protein
MEAQTEQDAFTKQHAGPFLDRLKLMGEQGAPNIGKASHYIVIAE